MTSWNSEPGHTWESIRDKWCDLLRRCVREANEKIMNQVNYYNPGDICLIKRSTSSQFRGLGRVVQVSDWGVTLELLDNAGQSDRQAFFFDEVSRMERASNDVRWGDTVRILDVPGSTNVVGCVRPDNHGDFTHGKNVPWPESNGFRVDGHLVHGYQVSVIHKATPRPKPPVTLTLPSSRDRRLFDPWVIANSTSSPFLTQKEYALQPGTKVWIQFTGRKLSATVISHQGAGPDMRYSCVLDMNERHFVPKQLVYPADRVSAIRPGFLPRSSSKGSRKFPC